MVSRVGGLHGGVCGWRRSMWRTCSRVRRRWTPAPAHRRSGGRCWPRMPGLSQLLELRDYTGVQPEILALLGTLGLLDGDEGEYVRMRRLRGRLLRRP